MSKFWYRRILIMFSAFTVSVGGSYYLIQYQQKKLQKEVSAGMSEGQMLIPGGMPIGIYLEMEGAMVLGTEAVTDVNGMKCEPAELLLMSGDYILALDEQKIRY